MRPFHILILLFALTWTAADAQIFINTGNADVDKYKQENPNAAMYEGKAVADSTKALPDVKTPPVKIVQPTDTAVKHTANKKQTTAPKKLVAPRPVKPAAPAIAATRTAPTPAYTITATDTGSLPPNAEVGKCYARCLVPDKYETKEETVIDKPLSYKTKTIPATYKTLTDTIITKPASIRYKDIPAVYETTTEDVLISPATHKWVKSTADKGCLSANPADCQVLCLQQIPAVYKKVSHKIVKTPATRQEIPVPAEYKIVTTQVVDQPARQEKTEIAATYKKVTHKQLVSKGGYSEWKEILCGNKLTTSKVTEIQKALKANGYYGGTIDDIFGAQTKAALIKYQTDKGLPVGNLNMETLKSLGVE